MSLNFYREMQFAKVLRPTIYLAIKIWIFVLWNTSPLFSQVKGKITDSDGLPLPYAAIYIDGTSYGTLSNVDGFYELDLNIPGKYKINYQYVGYQDIQMTANYTNKPLEINVIMRDDQLLLNEVVIKANAEDPAYSIIREAIRHRPENKYRIQSLEADLYVKGLIKLTEVPQKFLGEEIGNLNGILDSLRQGILYLSESKSKFYFEQPDKIKEIMVSSIKSGDNSLFTANQFSWASFNLYDNYLEFGRSIVSPIGDNALSNYLYKLDKTYEDKDHFVIHKIKIEPKSKNTPALSGHIFIVDGYWTIHSSDLKLHGIALKNTYFDTIAIKQHYIPIENRESWMLFSQIFQFQAGLLGFRVGGDFTYIFSNYKLNADNTELFKNNERFKVEAHALERDTSFWNRERPIPLTKEEERDYIKKDSLLAIWSSKSYLDSMDRESNKLSPIHLILGYTYSNTYKKRKFTIPPPLSSVKFNAVEGFLISLLPYWTVQDSSLRRFKLQPSLDYGFSDHKFKPNILLDYTFDNYSLGNIQLSGGIKYRQFDAQNPVNERSNAWYSLWSKRNSIRLYRDKYVGINYFQELINGVYLDLSSTYSNRSNLVTNTNYSFRKKDLKYDENIPNYEISPDQYQENSYLLNKIKVTIRPGQTYSSYPNFKIRHSTDWPTITTEFESGYPLMADKPSFYKLTLRIRDQYVNLRKFGYFRYNVEGGTFLKGKPGYFADYLHPVANRIAIPIDPDLSSFNLLPFYQYSTDRYYLQLNIRHHFNGYVFDRIQLINKTPLRLTFGSSALYVPEKGYYLEPFIGIENFKIGPLHLFDIDYAFSFDKHGFLDHGIVFRLSQLLNSL